MNPELPNPFADTQRFSEDPAGALLDIASAEGSLPGQQVDAVYRLRDLVWEDPQGREDAIEALALLAGEDSDPMVSSSALDCLDYLSKSIHADGDPELRRLLSEAIHEAKSAD